MKFIKLKTSFNNRLTIVFVDVTQIKSFYFRTDTGCTVINADQVYEIDHDVTKDLIKIMTSFDSGKVFSLE